MDELRIVRRAYTVGPLGPRGPLGPVGPKGEQGPIGLKGDKGDMGPMGPRGPQGAPFTYEDFTEDQLEGLRGPQGPQGEQGPQGVQGIQGTQGEKGDKGDPGVQGPKGDPFTYEDFTAAQLEALRGPQGEQGPAGRDGSDGADGQDGTPGQDGQDGVTPHIDSTTGNWFIGTTDTGVHAQGPAGQDGQDAVLPTLATVATSGSYNDLSNKPSIPSKTSDLTNDSNFLSVANYDIDQNLYVDMGLPSGMLWAKKNIDVTQADGFAASEYLYECSFFSWGNTDGHNPTSTSSFEPYSFSDELYPSSEGAKINYPDSVNLSHDAARIVLGGLWRTPTAEDFVELFDSNYTKFIDADGNDIASDVADKRVTVNSIVGIRLKSKVNGNTIFFPCSGDGIDQSWIERGLSGLYLSASLRKLYPATYGHGLLFNSGGVYPQNFAYRFRGLAVRPIISTKFATSDVAITGDYNDLINKPTIPQIWRGTQAQYDLLTPDDNTIYIITSAS